MDWVTDSEKCVSAVAKKWYFIGKRGRCARLGGCEEVVI